MKSYLTLVLIQEAKPYKNDPEILAMTNLVSAYQNNDINEFELILKHNRQTIMEDLFIREHIEDLLRNIRTQVRLPERVYSVLTPKIGAIECCVMIAEADFATFASAQQNLMP